MAQNGRTQLRVATTGRALARPRVHYKNRLVRIVVALPLVGLAALLVSTNSYIAYVGAALLFAGAMYILPPKGAYTNAELAQFESQKFSIPGAEDIPTTEELIAAEAAASAGAEQRQAELNAGQLHLAELEAFNDSTKQELVLDEPEPYTQLGASPFRDNFVPLEQRVLRPAQPAARPMTANPTAPQSAESATAVQRATGPLPQAPKLLK